MLETTILRSRVWTTVQEPRTPACIPHSYLLLSALDAGWTISSLELAASWDQHGLIYLVTLRQEHSLSQELILPRNTLVSSLLDEYFSEHELPSA